MKDKAMSEKMRDEFNEWYGKQWAPESIRDDLWAAWKASRAALVIELPPEREEKFIGSYEEGWNDAIDSCRVRLESVGVICK